MTLNTTLPPDLFTIQNDELYINSIVLNYGMPTGTYQVRVNLIDLETNQVIDFVNHSIYVTPCECVLPTTSTTSTTTTTTSTTPYPDRKSTRLNSSHVSESRMPSSA